MVIVPRDRTTAGEAPHGPIRRMVQELGLDDPAQVRAGGVRPELLAQIAAHFPRLAQVLATHRPDAVMRR